ncbi:ABC transporter substrate-binding protein [Bradyrhizobium sp. CSS354]|uniref:ABC transporter substrate-binding protein n=1 Tax=Bradyrhizobium sp. CSS354 TaxID=2699172 RepID=UPI0023AF5B08|nr:extracellular solute-binding protein [Bradyrhizobium sp. CSS354]MDE5466277.1 extracellular solute-binding protein [Bradyrhizobium sp. CSS354]
MMKTIAWVISAIAGALIGVTAAHADPVTLRVGYAFPARDGLFRQPIVERFMQQNPGIRIVTEANAADCPALLQQLLRAAVTGDLPDVVASLCYPDMPVLAERGLLVPLDSFLAADPLWAAVGVRPEALAATQWKGKTIALPESVSTSIVYYNMDVIRKVRPNLSNLDLSWDDILSLADNIHTSIPALVPIFFEYYPDSYNWSFHALVYSHGGDVFTPDGKIAFDGAAGQAALQLMHRFGETGMVDMTTEQARQAFASGKIGIYVASSSRLEQLTANLGSTRDIRTGPFPHSAADGRMPSGGSGLAIMTRDSASGVGIPEIRSRRGGANADGIEDRIDAGQHDCGQGPEIPWRLLQIEAQRPCWPCRARPDKKRERLTRRQRVPHHRRDSRSPAKCRYAETDAGRSARRHGPRCPKALAEALNYLFASAPLRVRRAINHSSEARRCFPKSSSEQILLRSTLTRGIHSRELPTSYLTVI